MKKATILFSLLCVVGLCSCNGKSKSIQETGTIQQSQGKAIEYTTMTTYVIDGNELSGITAEIKDGKVYVSVDADQFAKAPFARGMDYRLNETTYEVQNLDAPIVSIHIGDIGQDYNPVLCMLRGDGKVQIASLFDGIGRLGFFQASYPLPNLNNIVAFKAKTFEDYVGIAAVDGDGMELEIPYNPAGLSEYAYATSAGTQLRLTFTPDWKIICQHFISGPDGGVQEIKEYVGEYTLAYINDEYNNQEIAYTIHTLSNVLSDDNAPKSHDSKGTFKLQYVDGSAQTLTVTPLTGNLFPLPMGKPATFTRDEQ